MGSGLPPGMEISPCHRQAGGGRQWRAPMTAPPLGQVTRASIVSSAVWTSAAVL